jgi:hypothetical protein
VRVLTRRQSITSVHSANFGLFFTTTDRGVQMLPIG